jgi:hypothetical protein
MTKFMRNTIERAEPWSDKEFSMYSSGERAFIRDIQISKNMNKEKAEKFYINYLHKSDKQRQKIRGDIIQDIRDLSPKHKHKRFKTTGKFHRPEKTEAPEEKEPIEEKKEFSDTYNSFDEWLQIQQTRGLGDSKQVRRAFYAHERYPDDTLYQLQHGHSAYDKREEKQEENINEE